MKRPRRVNQDLLAIMQRYGISEDGEVSEGSEGKKHPPLFPEVRQLTNKDSSEKTGEALGSSPPSPSSVTSVDKVRKAV
ncbi:MAG: hypothetical protein FJ358_08180 [Thaumarchaeota archaeon]|nr:hypothetical protein [Nitrososphaerota archaeon]